MMLRSINISLYEKSSYRLATSKKFKKLFTYKKNHIFYYEVNYNNDQILSESLI